MLFWVGQPRSLYIKKAERSPFYWVAVQPFVRGATEIRTREPVLPTTRFPGACLSSISACITDVYTIRALHLRVICARAAILTFVLASPTLALSLHICDAKLRTFNHICKSFARFFIKRSNLSSSTSLSSSDSLKWGQDNTPIVSASRYTRLNKAPLSIGEAGSDSGRIVSKRQPQPEHSGVRRHQSALERNRQQSFMFEHILDSSEEEVMIILL